MKKNETVAPVLKWAGGKRQLLEKLAPLLPEKITTYFEPFVGGGAMLFYLQPRKAYVNDINAAVIQVYEVIRDNPKGLIAALKKYENTTDCFYEVRAWDRDEKKFASLSDVEKASRTIFLNHTCFNGLFRVNATGNFNVPFGKYVHPVIVNEELIRADSAYFNTADIKFSSEDFTKSLRYARKGEGTFVYFDPPYDPLSDTANFTSYSSGGFTKADQIRLREYCDNLTQRGIKFMLSNSCTDFILDQYKNYNIEKVKAKRAVNAVGTGRGDVDEVVVRNYE